MMLKFETQVAPSASAVIPHVICVDPDDILGLAQAVFGHKVCGELVLRGGVRVCLSDEYEDALKVIEEAKERRHELAHAQIVQQSTAAGESTLPSDLRECACGDVWRPAVGLYGTTDETRCCACTLREMLKKERDRRERAETAGAHMAARIAALRDYKIITLCGSARFEPWFHLWNKLLSMSGHIVFTLTAWPSVEGEKLWYTDEQKKALDEIHFKKIEQGDAVLVLNVHAYIGESTMNEIRHATKLGKDVYFLESWGEGNGVGSVHFEYVQKHAYDLLGRTDYRSPIDTFPHSGTGRRCATDLLCEAGPLRNSLVEMMHSLDPVEPGGER